MATILEEMRLKLGVDQSSVTPELNSFKDNVKNATDHAHVSFMHAESSGRAFHKVLHGISEQSPVMGAALRLALSPVAGTLMAAGMAFAYVNRLIEEGNQRLDKMAEIGRMSFGNVKEAAVEAGKVVEELNRKYAEADARAAASRADKADTTRVSRAQKEKESASRVAAEQVASIRDLALDQVKQDEASGKISQGEAIERRNAIHRDYAKTQRAMEIAGEQGNSDLLGREMAGIEPQALALEQEQIAARGAANDPHRAQQIALRKKDAEAMKSALAKVEEELQKVRDFRSGVRDRFDLEPDWFYKERIGYQLQAYENTTGMRPDQHEAFLARQKAQFQAAIAKAEASADTLSTQQKDADARAQLAETNANKLEERYKGYQESREDALRRVRELKAKPLNVEQEGVAAAAQQLFPTIAQIAGMTEWAQPYVNARPSLQPTSYALEAQELMRLEAEAPTLMDPRTRDLHDREVNRINEIKEDLRRGGLMGAGAADQPVVKHLEAISQTLTGGGQGLRVVFGNVD